MSIDLSTPPLPFIFPDGSTLAIRSTNPDPHSSERLFTAVLTLPSSKALRHGIEGRITVVNIGPAYCSYAVVVAFANNYIRSCFTK